jgi:hypothetical protein
MATLLLVLRASLEAIRRTPPEHQSEQVPLWFPISKTNLLRVNVFAFLRATTLRTTATRITALSRCVCIFLTRVTLASEAAPEAPVLAHDRLRSGRLMPRRGEFAPRAGLG